MALTVPALTTLVSFNGTNGAVPEGSLIADAHGDLFGTTLVGGANNVGTVFEIAKTSHGYASTPTTLVSFNGTNGTVPHGSLIADAHGNLFGTTGQGGSNNFGTVFEIAKTAHGYASTPTTLVSFNFTNGADPIGSLIADAHGDLFGTTHEGGPLEGGLGRRRHGVRDCQDFPWLRQHSQHLVSFPQNGATLGAFPGAGSLIADSHGDLFGTTQVGGANNFGTVFEIAKTAHGYASTPTTTLVSFKARTVPIRTVA